MKRLKIISLLFLLGLSTSICAVKESDMQAEIQRVLQNIDQEKALKSYKEFLELNEKGFLNSVLSVFGGVLSVAEGLAYTLLTPVQQVIKLALPAITENPYRNLKATVRCGDPICEPELLFRDKRLIFVKEAQEKMLSMELEPEDVLEIGFSHSGGGWRAMLCAIGSCAGADKIGLLNCAMNISGLSGSTWFIAPWVYSGLHIEYYRERAIKVASEGIDLQSFSEITPLLDSLLVKFAYSEPLNIVDLYGGLLANSLFRGLKDDPHRAYVSAQRENVMSGRYPFPVYTATLGERMKDEFWFEFTPFEVGSRWLNAYVPTWAFGRHFKRGVSKDYAPEQSTGFLCAIFGSAFAADFEDLYETMIQGLEIPSFMEYIPFGSQIFDAIKQVVERLAYTDFGDLRIAWSRVPNFVYKMHGMPHSSYKELRLVDAGLDFNNPVFVTYRKPPYGDAPDIIFIFDAGATVEFKEVQALVDYAKYHGLKFPKIEPYEVDKHVISVFKDDDDIEVPVVVYMPRLNGLSLLMRNNYKGWYDYYLDLLDGFDIDQACSSGFADTFNFDYTKREAETIVAMTEFNVISVSNKIKEIMKERIEAKRKFRNKK